MLPEPFSGYLDKALHDCYLFEDIRASFRIVDPILIDESNTSIWAEDIEFKVGKTICKELKGSSRLAFFVGTAGKTISEKSSMLLEGEDPVLGYIYDILGSFITEAVCDRIQEMLKKEVSQNDEKITNRYSPGYCQWHVNEQHKLFSLFNDSTCGVTLTTTALMQPVKSISGVIGIGENVTFRKYQCELCGLKKCTSRSGKLHS